MKYFLAVAMILTGFFGTVYAVPEPFSTEEVFKFSDSVIVGKILSVEILSEPQMTKTDNYYSEKAGIAVYKVQVEKYLKNPADSDIIIVSGLFLREPHGMSYETYPYEEGQRTILYLQKNDNGYGNTDLIITSPQSKIIEDTLCPLGTSYVKGKCIVNPDCGPGTVLKDGVCVVVFSTERGIFMHGALGPVLLITLFGILTSPIYAILKFKKPINKVLFVASILITAIIFSQVIYGEFFLIGDSGVAPSANESHFFALSILGSFFVTISFAILGIVYWRKNENSNKIILFAFFIIAIIPVIALMTGLLPRGANA